MKLNRLFVLGLAGLTFAACSNDEIDSNAMPEGNGSITVKIVSPESRTVPGTPEANGEKVLVQGPITLKLTAVEGGATVTLDENAKEYKFWNVKSPSKIEAWVNNGDKVLETTSIVNEKEPAMQALPKSIPAYGSSTTFTLSGKEENNGKTYDMYKASVEMKIPVARMEVSGIAHVDEGDGCEYGKLTIDGIYLDKILPTKGGEPTDYCMPAKGDIAAPILWEAIVAPDNNFLEANGVWPKAEGQVYAFNFYPSTTMPILKLYFKEATASDPNQTFGQPRYAMVKSYNGDANYQFAAGNIYRITNVKLSDKNIIGDEEGNTFYGVDVTVTEAQWTVVDTTTDWIEQ